MESLQSLWELLIENYFILGILLSVFQLKIDSSGTYNFLLIRFQWMNDFQSANLQIVFAMGGIDNDLRALVPARKPSDSELRARDDDDDDLAYFAES